MVTELNRFASPGPDVHLFQKVKNVIYDALPEKLFRPVLDAVMRAEAGLLKATNAGPIAKLSPIGKVSVQFCLQNYLYFLKNKFLLTIRESG